MISILVVNDAHLADRPPVGRTEDYCDRIFAKLEECGEIAAAENCDYVVVTGDLFHIKRPNHNSHQLVRRLIALLEKFPTVLVVPGNHDLSESGLPSLEKQPLGVLAAAGAVELLLEDKLLFDESEYKDDPGTRMCVQLSPAPYRDDIDADPKNYKLVRSPMVHWAVKVAHGMLVPKKDAGHWEARHVPHTTYDQVADRKTDLVLWGHPHYDYGIQEVRTTTFASLGSLSRVARTRENRKRKMRVLQVNFTRAGMIFKTHALKSARPAAEVFVSSAAEVSSEVELTEPLTAFARRLSKSLQVDTWAAIDQVLAKFAPKSDKRVRELVRGYLEEAGWN